MYVVQVVQSSPSTQEVLVLSLVPHNMVVIEHTCNPRTQKVQARESEGEGLPQQPGPAWATWHPVSNQPTNHHNKNKIKLRYHNSQRQEFTGLWMKACWAGEHLVIASFVLAMVNNIEDPPVLGSDGSILKYEDQFKWDTVTTDRPSVPNDVG